jgi:hypothetical protein
MGVEEVGRDFQARRRWARGAGGRFASGAVRSRGAWREEERSIGGDAAAVGVVAGAMARCLVGECPPRLRARRARPTVEADSERDVWLWVRVRGRGRG